MPIEYIAIMIPFVAIIAGAKVALTALQNYHQLKLLKLEASSPKANSSTASSERMEMLEDRVAVLERIVTDRGYNVAAEIERLRDDTGLTSISTSGRKTFEREI